VVCAACEVCREVKMGGGDSGILAACAAAAKLGADCVVSLGGGAVQVGTIPHILCWLLSLSLALSHLYLSLSLLSLSNCLSLPACLPVCLPAGLPAWQVCLPRSVYLSLSLSLSLTRPWHNMARLPRAPQDAAKIVRLWLSTGAAGPARLTRDGFGPFSLGTTPTTPALERAAAADPMPPLPPQVAVPTGAD
jgi:hypothetical protein